MAPALLLVDDSITIQRVVELTLASEGIEVVGVVSRSEALARLASAPPDIVLADVGRPEPDGCALAADMKADPRFARIPIVLLTSALEPLDEGRTAGLQHDAVLSTPFDPAALIHTVKRLLARRDGAPALGPTTLRDASPAEEPDAWEAAADALPAAGATDPLDAYFDRLDAAFADLRTAGPYRRDPAASPRAGEDVRGSASREDENDALAGCDPALAEPETVPAPSSANPFVALFAPDPVPRRDGAASASRPHGRAAVTLPDDVLDQIAERVIARMNSDAMRRLVLDTAERLVRDEIERIKGG